MPVTCITLRLIPFDLLLQIPIILRPLVINELNTVCQRKFTYWNIEATEEGSIALPTRRSNSITHSPSSQYTDPAICPPSFAPSPGSFAQMDCRLEDSLTEKCAHRETGKWSTDAGRCMFHLSYATLQLLLIGAM